MKGAASVSMLIALMLTVVFVTGVFYQGYRLMPGLPTLPAGVKSVPMPIDCGSGMILVELFGQGRAAFYASPDQFAHRQPKAYREKDYLYVRTLVPFIAVGYNLTRDRDVDRLQAAYPAGPCSLLGAKGKPKVMNG